MNPTKLLLLPALLLATLAAATPAPDDAAVVREQVLSYPLGVCAISGDELVPGATVDHVVEGRLVRLCCEDCKAGVAKRKDAVLAKIDAAVIAEQSPRYPSEVCLVSGEDLGSMGEPIDLVHGTRLVRLCCKGCKKGFALDPASYLADLDEAVKEARREDYPLDVCVVSGEELGSMGDPVEVVAGVELVRLCCKGCKKSLMKDPRKHLAKIRAAAREGEAAGEATDGAGAEAGR
jgi:type II secretory ATPase GspE/PulE/Tfp pilus assembly ATPase PilB-like protein